MRPSPLDLRHAPSKSDLISLIFAIIDRIHHSYFLVEVQDSTLVPRQNLSNAQAIWENLHARAPSIQGSFPTSISGHQFVAPQSLEPKNPMINELRSASGCGNARVDSACCGGWKSKARSTLLLQQPIVRSRAIEPPDSPAWASLRFYVPALEPPLLNHWRERERGRSRTRPAPPVVSPCMIAARLPQRRGADRGKGSVRRNRYTPRPSAGHGLPPWPDC